MGDIYMYKHKHIIVIFYVIKLFVHKIDTKLQNEIFIKFNQNEKRKRNVRK